MRPQQQNRRMRGRNNNNNNNNNNRKGPNPLTRSYESNGPDVKIRGSAQQIAEKYTTLARDAMSSGDRVMAENYLQHAEHYNRIIAAAQAQMPIQHQGNGARDDASDDDVDDERDEFDGIGLPQPLNQQNQRQGGGNYNQGQGYQGQNRNNGGDGGYGQNSQHSNGSPAQANQALVNHAEAPQPVIEGMPAEIALNNENAGSRDFGQRGERGESRERRERRRDRDNKRFDNRDNRDGGNPEGQSAASGEAPAPREETAPAPRDAAPERVEAVQEAPAVTPPVAFEVSATSTPEGEAEAAPRRGRRPRRRREGEEGAAPELDLNTAPAEG